MLSIPHLLVDMQELHLSLINEFDLYIIMNNMFPPLERLMNAIGAKKICKYYATVTNKQRDHLSITWRKFPIKKV